MTVNTDFNQVTYQANGSTTQWTFPFSYVDAETIFVTVTDSEGTATPIPASQYTLVLNPPIDPNPTGVGGLVVFPISGPALAPGNLITISRELEAIQPVSLTNQSIIYPPVIEREFDYLTMLRQQGVAEASRAFRVGLQDPIPRVVPPVAQRAQQGAFFDINGDLVPGQAPGGTVFISAAMQPVVGAGTIAVARTLLGLGSMATASIGLGLQLDVVTNSVRVNVGIRKINTSQSPLPALHNSVDVTTGNLTYTLGPANSYFNGFGFYVNCVSGRVTLVPNGTDKIFGLNSGVTWTIPQGAYAFIQTDGIDTWYLSFSKLPLPTGVTFFGGSGNYTPPLGVARLRVQMVAGGGAGGNGGGGSNVGGSGGGTFFDGWSTGGGNGGAGSQGAAAGFAGIGGSGGSNGVGTLIVRAAGGDGTCGTPWIDPTPPAMLLSGIGGASYFGGGGTNTFSTNTAFPSRCFGAGGGGGPNANQQFGTGAGGGAGEYVSFWRDIVGMTTIPWGVGAAGPANGAGSGTAGVIIIEEFYGGP